MEVAQASRRPRFYYGWYIVGLAFLSQLMSAGLQGYTLGVFMKPMIDELGWSRGGISAAQSVGTLVNGLLAPFIGGILDRRGGKALMLFGSVVFGLGFMSLCLMQDIWQFYLIRGFVMTVGMVCMGNLVVYVAISNWFVRKRGRAVTIASMGISFGGVVLAPLAEFLISNYGWRNALAILGALVLLVMLPPTARFMRRRPEDMGLTPDGEDSSTVNQRTLSAVQKAAIAADVKWTRSEAMRTPALWMIIASFGLAGMGLGAMMMHITPYVSDLGFSDEIAAMATSVQALASLICKPFWAVVLERVHVRYTTMLAFGTAALGMAILTQSRSIEMIYFALSIYGFGMGGQVPIQEVVWANYFGRITLGTVRSIGMPFMIISSAGGPLMAGVTYDLTKSYQGAFLILLSAYILAIVIMAFVRPPKHPQSTSSTAQLV